MKKIILILSAFMPLLAASQISFDFEEGSAAGWLFNENGRWNAEAENALNGAYSLHHSFDNSLGATDVAMFNIADLCPACADVLWNVTVRHGTEPSSSNKWHFLLMSDTGPEETAQSGVENGYAVGVNMTGYDDTLRLYHIKGGKANTVITAAINWQNDVGTSGAAEICVKRTPQGFWTLSVTWSGGNRTWNGFSTETHLVKYAGICYTYTSSRDRLLWIDDVSLTGTFVPDNEPPQIKSVTALAPDLLEVVFDEEPADFSVNASGIGIPSGPAVTVSEKKSPFVIRLSLRQPLGKNRGYSLVFSSLCDASGNCREEAVADFTAVFAVAGDIVITEIMADPSPPVTLPEDEFIEMTNITSDSLAITGWILISDRDTVSLPDFWLKSDEAAILCSTSDAPELSHFGKTIGVASFPSLNDSGETISLRDRTNKLVHTVSYTPDYYHDDLRSGGGWSLEMTDTSNPFNEPDTWMACCSTAGGTPGKANSRNIAAPDNRCPQLVAVYPVSPVKVHLVFDETVFNTDGCWLFDNQKCVESVPDGIADRTVTVMLEEMLSAGKLYSLSIPPSVSDFAGNALCISSLEFGVPEVPGKGDVLFNELLFNPVPPCTDYIEFYNNSGKVIDLSKLSLASAPQPASLITPVSVPRQLLPGDYIALTAEKASVSSFYLCSDENKILQVASLPSMPDDKGSIVLYNQNLEMVDMTEYSNAMHLCFLSSTEGISLEKVNPALPSDNRDNWHSASETCNWGSPGYENSIMVPDVTSTAEVTLSGKRISPDGDGFEDVLSVTVVPGGTGNVITVTLFNDRGFTVRHLAGRFYADEGAVFIWDGTDDNGDSLPAGLYMILTESYNTEGKTHRWKNVCALLYR